MKPERWQRIEQLYHAALDRAPNERAAYLAEACVAAGRLRRETEAERETLRQGRSSRQTCTQARAFHPCSAHHFAIDFKRKHFRKSPKGATSRKSRVQLWE